MSTKVNPKRDYLFFIASDNGRKTARKGLDDMSLSGVARLCLSRILDRGGAFAVNLDKDKDTISGLYELWNKGYIKREGTRLTLTDNVKELGYAGKLAGLMLESWVKVYSDYPEDKAAAHPYDSPADV